MSLRLRTGYEKTDAATFYEIKFAVVTEGSTIKGFERAGRHAGRHIVSDDVENSEASLRIDKWLWFARFFKSRSQATAAVAGGLVHVNDERVKPSRVVHVNDRLTITRDETRFEVIVTGLPSRRGPATEAQRHYAETEASVTAREARRENARHAPPAPDGRPDKHARRSLRDLRRQ